MTRGVERKTFLFTLRVWAEPVEENQVEWRGKLQRLPDGEAQYFRCWSGLVKNLETILDSAGCEEDLAINEETGGQI